MDCSIYVHIPFCESKCFYCAFASFSNIENEQKNYFENLEKEIKRDKHTANIKSIYIGGGTPSFVDCNYIKKILDLLMKKYDVDKNAEITIEVNPNSINESKLTFYKKIGINRLSIGVQSLNNLQLKRIGRLHNKKQAINCIKLAKKVGFKNISCDLLLGLEKENFWLLKKSLRPLMKNVTHLSCYMLQVEDNTKLKDLIEKKQIILPNEDEVVNDYQCVIKYLNKHGFKQYEISNFAKEGFECKHNLNYWARGNYLGFGLAAHSFIGNKRWANAKTFDNYYKGIKELEEVLTKQQIIEEIIMLGLRCDLGVNLDKLKKLGYDIQKNPNFNYLLENNILVKNKNIINLLPKYYGVSNLIIEKLLN